ncbi:glycosyltransferase involved in cell wall biosynthesis [Mycolicibacterium sp. BK634]|uniref:glycosyltransferase family 2 protein n=1 Tax=Mycolicibacterium sp. BK634 TaxID=2587099 RepID=UPI00161D9AB7|nr:glycosyltransferase family A protein [Mycolicibacterium sp. BK634]MBB3748113.1 glycosyltransferase involved in cell wall biosynthesis [Mycolicibacterium sp. BK634]
MPDHSHTAVAAVIPARPNEPFLGEAIESTLAQPEVVEVLVATHQSDSPTAQLVRDHPDPRVRLVCSHGPSAGENLDAAVLHTTAPWLAFLDADDRWPTGRISTGLRAAGAAPGTQLVIGRQQAMDENGCLLSAIAPAPILGAVLARRDAVDHIGPFGNSLVAQMRWLLRAAELGVPALELSDVTLFRRSHAGNLSRVHRPELHQAYLSLARERVAGQRHTSGGS